MIYQALFRIKMRKSGNNIHTFKNIFVILQVFIIFLREMIIELIFQTPQATGPICYSSYLGFNNIKSLISLFSDNLHLRILTSAFLNIVEIFSSLFTFVDTPRDMLLGIL